LGERSVDNSALHKPIEGDPTFAMMAGLGDQKNRQHLRCGTSNRSDPRPLAQLCFFWVIGAALCSQA